MTISVAVFRDRPASWLIGHRLDILAVASAVTPPRGAWTPGDDHAGGLGITDRPDGTGGDPGPTDWVPDSRPARSTGDEITLAGARDPAPITPGPLTVSTTSTRTAPKLSGSGTLPAAGR